MPIRKRSDRLSLVQDIWDSIVPEADAMELPESVGVELDRRLAAHQANPSAAVPWEQIRAEALKRISQ